MADQDRDFREDIIDRLARIEEGVAGLYPRLKELEEKTERLETWSTRLKGGFAALSAAAIYLGHTKFVPIMEFISK